MSEENDCSPSLESVAIDIPKSHTYVQDVEVRKDVLNSIIAVVNTIFQVKKRPLVLSVGGPGGVGKSIFSQKLKKLLSDAEVIGLDAYRKEESERPEGTEGPNPAANRVDLIKTQMKHVRAGEVYMRRVKTRGNSTIDEVSTQPSMVNIFEGELSTYSFCKDLVDLSIFIDGSEQVQMKTRLNRDVAEDGLTVEQAKLRFQKSNIEQFGEHGRASKNWSDVQLLCHDDYSLEILSVSKALQKKIGNIFR